MTLLDAPAYDAARAKRRLRLLYALLGAVLLLIVAWWLAASRPIDWPWNWNAHLLGRRTANRFLQAVERNDLPAAYAIWLHDPQWRQHPQAAAYSYERFESDWSPSSHENEYGVIKSHKIVAARIYGNVLLMAILINDRKTGVLSLDYDPRSHQLNFSPEGVELYLGP
jgi:hypothetical protein